MACLSLILATCLIPYAVHGQLCKLFDISNRIILIADIIHSWTVGPNWPNDGEINIIEGVNQQTRNRMTLHTNTGCSINNSGFYGELITNNCGGTDQSAKVGCSIDSYSSASYGDGFNHMGGGVYALEWTSSAINIWFFPRGSVPANVDSLSPNPSTWGTPTTRLADTCDIDHHFRNHSIVRIIAHINELKRTSISKSVDNEVSVYRFSISHSVVTGPMVSGAVRLAHPMGHAQIMSKTTLMHLIAPTG